MGKRGDVFVVFGLKTITNQIGIVVVVELNGRRAFSNTFSCALFFTLLCILNDVRIVSGIKSM